MIVGGSRDKGIMQVDRTWKHSDPVHVAEVERGPLGAGGCGCGPGVAGGGAADGFGCCCECAVARVRPLRLQRLSLELGGNAPFVVCADADIESAAQGLMNSKFRNCGQTCIASNRVLVHSSKQDVFLQAILPKIQELTVGDGFVEQTTLGPMINQVAVQKIRVLVQDALDKGAGILMGELPMDGSQFVSPIVLTGIESHMDVWNTEIFGPVVAVRTFEDDNHALRLANDTEYGLAAYVYTQGQKRSWMYSEKLKFGMIGVNTGRISTSQAPFGGVKQSGFGREGSWLGLDEYLSVKYTCLDLE